MKRTILILSLIAIALPAAAQFYPPVLKTDGNLYLNVDAATDEARIYFGSPSGATAESIVYNPTDSQYDVSDDVNISGALTASGAAALGDELLISNGESSGYTGLEIENTETASKKFAVFVNSDSTTYGIPKAFTIRDITTGVNRFTIDPDTGNVGIKVVTATTLDSASAALYVDGSAYFCGEATAEAIFLTPTADLGAIADTPYIYAQGDDYEIYVMDGTGNKTKISNHGGYHAGFQPQPDDPAPFVYMSENEYIGKRVEIDLSGLLREVEKLTGKSFIKYTDIPVKEVEPGREMPAWVEERIPEPGQ